MLSFREKNRIKRELARPSEEYMNAMREERMVTAARKNERDYFLAGQTRRPKHKPGKASARTQAYYGYYFETLKID